MHFAVTIDGIIKQLKPKKYVITLKYPLLFQGLTTAKNKCSFYLNINGIMRFSASQKPGTCGVFRNKLNGG